MHGPSPVSKKIDEDAGWLTIRWVKVTVEPTATERSRDGRDGVYDVTVTVEEAVVAEFTGRSREVGGPFWDDEGSRS